MSNSTVVHMKLKDEVTKELERLKEVSTSTIHKIADAQNKLVNSNEALSKSSTKVKEANLLLIKAKRDLEKIKQDKTADKNQIATAKKLVAEQQKLLNLAKLKRNEDLANVSEYKKQISILSSTKNIYKNQIHYGKEKLDNLKQQNIELKKQRSYQTNINSTYTRGTNSVNKFALANKNLVNSFVRHIRQVESLIVSYYLVSNAWNKTIGLGVQYNKAIENNSYGLAALIASNTELVDSQGRVLSSGKKFNASLLLSKETLKKVKTASLETSATFPELTEVFQQAIGYSMRMGDSFASSTKQAIDRTIELTSSLTNMGGAIGMASELVLEETRSLFSGDVTTDSKLGILLFGSPKQANEAIRQTKKGIGEYANDVYGLLKDKLKEFDNLKVIDTLQRAQDKIKDSWETLWGDMAIPINDDIKQFLKEIRFEIDSNKKEWVESFKKMYAIAKDGLPILNSIVKVLLAIKLGKWLYSLTTSAWKLGTVALPKLYRNLKITEIRTRGLGGEITSIDRKVLAMSSTLKRIPFIFVAGLALNFATSLVTATDKNDLLNGSLRRTREELEKLGKAQLDYKKTKNELEKKDTLREISELKSDLAPTYVGSRSGTIYEKKHDVDSLDYKKKKADLEKLEENLKKIDEEQEIINKLLKKAEESIKSGNKKVGVLKAKSDLKTFDLDKLLAKQKEELELSNKSTEAEKQKYRITLEYAKKRKEILKNFGKAKDLLDKDDDKLNEYEIEAKKKLNSALINLETQKNIKISEIRKTEKTKVNKGYEKNLDLIIRYYELENNQAEAWKNKKIELEEKYIGIEKKIKDRLLEDDKKRFLERFKSEDKSLKDKTEALKQYYELTGNYGKLWEKQEKEIKEKYKNLLTTKQLETFLKLSKKNFFSPFKKEISGIESTWNNITSSMTQSFEDNFFDALTGKFNNFKDFIKDFGRDILKVFTTPMFRGIAKYLAGGLSSILLPKSANASNLADTLKSAGLSLVNGEWVGGGDTEGKPNIRVGADGTVIQGSDALSKIMSSDGVSVLSAIGTLKSSYSLLSGGLTSALYAPATGMANLASLATTAGYTGAGNFLAGSTSVLSGGGTLTGAGTGAMAGGLLTAGALGGLGGYAVGSIGDSLLGADTKAGNFGAIGGATGAMIGSVVPVVGTLIGGAIGAGIGSLIGGAIGSWKTTGKGFELYNELYAGDSLSNNDIQTYIKSKKKSWFKTKNKTKYYDLSDKDLKNLEGQIKNIQYALKTAGFNKDFNLMAGQFGDLNNGAFATSILNEFTSYFVKDGEEWVKNKDFTEINNVWQSYAKSIDKDVYVAIAEALSNITKTRRSFKEWTLKNNPLKLTEFKANYLNDDVKNIAKSMGIDFAKITKENFLEKYNEATKNSFDPTTINNWNKLADAFKNASNAQEQYTETLIKTTQNAFNAQISFYKALGEDATGLMLESKKSEIFTWVLQKTTAGESYKQKLRDLGQDKVLELYEKKFIGLKNGSEVWDGVNNLPDWLKGGNATLRSELLSRVSSYILMKKQIEASKNKAINNDYNPVYTDSIKLFTNDLDKLIKKFSEGSNYLKQTYTTSKNAIDNILKNNNKYQKAQYQYFINKAKKYNSLVKTDPYNIANTKALFENTKEASAYVQGYLNKDRFSSEFDYKFAQLKTANTFQDFKNTTSVYEKIDELLKEIKELKQTAKTQVEINEATARFTKDSVEILEEMNERDEETFNRKVGI